MLFDNDVERWYCVTFGVQQRWSVTPRDEGFEVGSLMAAILVAGNEHGEV